MARDLSKPSYYRIGSNGKRYLAPVQSPGSKAWSNLTHKKSNLELADLARKIQSHEMFPYVQIGHLFNYVYVRPNTVSRKIINQMKKEALLCILDMLDAMRKAC